MKRFLAVFLMLAILLTGLTVTASAETGWVKKDGNWYYFKADGTMVTSDWVQTGGKWYYLGEDGVMKQDEVFNDNKNWYAADADGAMASNVWFCETWEDEKWDGTLFTGSTWFYAGADGVLVRGWKKIGKSWYYFEEDKDYRPVMYAYDEYEINDKYYAFKASGEMIVGWGQPWYDWPWATEHDTNWVYANADGSLVEGWKKIDGKWYYFWKDYPYMARNTIAPIKDGEIDYENGTLYGFTQSGAMVENGWFRREIKYRDGSVGYGPWYYFGKDGAAKKGWLQDKGKWYYLDATSGVMFADGQLEMSDGKTYGFKENGEMVVGWYAFNGAWYYFLADGSRVQGDWVKSGSKWYYLKGDGRMAASETISIAGKDYTFGDDGAWIEK